MELGQMSASRSASAQVAFELVPVEAQPRVEDAPIIIEPAVLPESQPDTSRTFIDRFKKSGAVLALASATLLAACNGVGNNAEAADTSKTSKDAKEAQKNSNECFDHLDFNLRLADSNYGSKEGIFPSLGEVKDGKTKLVKTEKATELLRTQVCNDSRALAVFEAVRELRDAKQLPSFATVTRIKNLAALYEQNPDAAKQAAEKVYYAQQFLVPTDHFAVTKGQADQIEVERDNGKITGYKANVVNSTRSFAGFELGYNRDDKTLTEDERALFDKLQDLVLFAADGTVVINKLTDTGSFKFATNEEQQPVSPQVAPNPLNNANTANNGSGTFGTSNNQGESNQPGSVPEQGGNGGFIPGKQTSFGGGGQGGGGGGETPPATTPKTPGTTPSTSGPPVTTTSTLPTSTSTKGNVPCDPNIARC